MVPEHGALGKGTKCERVVCVSHSLTVPAGFIDGYSVVSVNKRQIRLFYSQGDESSRAQWQDEKTRLVQEHQNQLERMGIEYDSKLKDQRAQIERDLGARMNNELQRARNVWQKQQQDARFVLFVYELLQFIKKIVNSLCDQALLVVRNSDSL